MKPPDRPGPPLPPAAPLLATAAAAIALSVVVLFVVRDPGPLDNSDEGAQRSGVLIPTGDARRVADLRLPNDPIGRRPVLLIFDRKAPGDGLARLVAQLPDDAVVVLALPDAPPAAAPIAAAAVVGRSPELAAAVGMPSPKEGGPPIGYAVIDEDARLRYRTLDPLYLDHADEITTMLGAVT